MFWHCIGYRIRVQNCTWCRCHCSFILADEELIFHHSALAMCALYSMWRYLSRFVPSVSCCHSSNAEVRAGIHVSDEGSVVKMTLVIAGILDWAVLFSRAWLKVIAGAVSAFIGRAIFRPIIRAVTLGRLFFLYEKSVAGIALSNSKLNNQNAFGSTPLLHHKAIHCFVFCSL